MRKPNKPENHESILHIYYVSLIKLELQFYFKGFDIFELRNIYKRIPNRIRIPILN